MEMFETEKSGNDMYARGHETVEHGADMGIKGRGRSAEEAFEETAVAMMELLTDSRGLVPERSICIDCKGDDLSGLLIEFLNSILLKSDLEELAVFEVTITRMDRIEGEWVLEASAGGMPRKGIPERLLSEVKAATYCGVSVEQVAPGRWEAGCVVDM